MTPFHKHLFSKSWQDLPNLQQILQTEYNTASFKKKNFGVVKLPVFLASQSPNELLSAF